MISPHYFLDRKRFGIQVKINIADDEIVRLRTFLKSLEAEKADAEDQLRKFERQIINMIEKSKHDQIRNNLTTVINSSVLRTSHLKHISQLRLLQAKQIQQIHDDFEKYFSQLEEWMNNNISNETKKLDAKIDIYRSKVVQCKKILQTQKDEMNVSSVEKRHIKEQFRQEGNRTCFLEKNIDSKRKEYYEELCDSKDKLKQVVQQIEQEERDHELLLNHMRSRLNILESEFNTRVKFETDQHEQKVGVLRAKLQKLLTQLDIIHKKNNIKQVDQRSRLEQLALDGETMKDLILKTPRKMIDDEPKEGDEYNDKLVSYYKNKIKNDESLLVRERMKNENLKREIQRLNHEIRVARYRAILLE